MTELGSAEGDRDLLEVLVEEYLARHRRGEAESIEEFVERSAKDHPTEAARIREELAGLLNTALVLESVVAEPRPGDPLLKPGQRIRHYCVERHIGSGGMGEVYLARNTMLNTSVAIKLLSPRYSNDPQLAAAFDREAKTAAQLDHRNVARVRDFFEDDGRHYLVMEFVEGQSLGELTKGGKPVPTEKLLDVGFQIAQGLATAHSRGIIHRDLKPHNVMITADGRVKILDFGLAKVDEARNRTSRDVGSSIFPSGVVVGTIGYMSPEQVCGDHVDARSDLFALGVVLYELATGLAPFRKSEFRAILTETPKPVTTLNRDVPLELDRVIDRLLAKKPADRYQSSEAVLEDLEALRSPRASEQETRPKTGLRIAVLLALVAVLVGVVIWTRWAGGPAQRIDNFTEEESETFKDHVEKGEVRAAWALLDGVEKRLGHREPTARQLLEGKVDELLKKWRHTVEGSLAGGEEPAEPDDRIKAIDDIKEGLVRERPGADHEDVGSFRGDAIEEASTLRSTVDRKSESIAERLESCPLDDAGSGIAGHPKPCPLETAWAEISSLRELKFRERAFTPAAEAAEAREKDLVKALEERLQADTGDASFDTHADLLAHVESSDAYEGLSNRCRSFKEHLDLLQRIEERNPGLKKFEETRKKLERDRTLLELLRGTEALDALERGGLAWQVTEAVAGETEKKLDEVLRRMRETDPTDESAYTRRVSKTVDAWKVAAETIGRFEDKSLDAVPEQFAGDEAVRSACQWLERYREAEEDPLEAEPPEVEGKELATRFQAPARRLLDKLEKIKVSEEGRRVGDLIKGVRERLRKLLLPTHKQRQELKELNSDDAKELRADIEKLELQLREWEKLEGDHAAIRQGLRRPEALDPARLKTSLDDVFEGMEEQRVILDGAIDFKPEFDPSLGECDKELRWRRARVSLRLGRYADVLRDVSASGRKETPEAQLLSCMASFGAKEYAEASECAEAVLANPGSAQADRARAHYWLATIAERRKHRTGARDHFQRAITLGGSDAYAHNRLALNLLALAEGEDNEDLLGQAVTHATECLSLGSPFSEDEMLTLFEGCSAADYRSRAIEFVCNALLSRAVARFHLGEYRACIEDCGEAMKKSPELADAYYWRALALYGLIEDGAGGAGDTKQALGDCDKAKHYATDEEQRKLADDLKKLIEDMK